MTYEERLNEVERMDNDVHSFNDEELILCWTVVGVPSVAREEFYEWFANNLVEFYELCSLYYRLKSKEAAHSSLKF